MYCKKCNCLLDMNSNFCQICGSPNPLKNNPSMKQPVIQNKSIENKFNDSNTKNISKNNKDIFYKVIFYLTVGAVLISIYYFFIITK